MVWTVVTSNNVEKRGQEARSPTLTIRPEFRADFRFQDAGWDLGPCVPPASDGIWTCRGIDVQDSWNEDDTSVPIGLNSSPIV